MGSNKKILLIGGCGYIGSYLYHQLHHQNYEVVVCDAQKRGNPANIPIQYTHYQNLSNDALENLDAVLWFGGHSSVAQALTDPQGALDNNCMDLYAFVNKLQKKTKFIYASTASLYSVKEGGSKPCSEKSLIRIPEQNAYDQSKFAFDYIAKNFLTNYYGLRMGTLAGFSPNLRPELLFNAMNLRAKQSGVVQLMNGESHRTILFLEDLWILVKNLIDHDHQPGFYNAGSVSGTMFEFAVQIAKVWNAKVRYEGDSNTYSFCLDCTKMQAICGNELLPMELSVHCTDFIEQYHAFQK